MATTTPAPSPTQTPQSEWTDEEGRVPIFSVFVFLWLIFGALLIFNQGALDTIWNRLLDLPLVLKVVAWILFLPITVGLWIWESAWALWLRLTLLIVVGVGWTAAMFPRPKVTPETSPATGSGGYEMSSDKTTP